MTTLFQIYATLD